MITKQKRLVQEWIWFSVSRVSIHCHKPFQMRKADTPEKKMVDDHILYLAQSTWMKDETHMSSDHHDEKNMNQTKRLVDCLSMKPASSWLSGRPFHLLASETCRRHQ